MQKYIIKHDNDQYKVYDDLNAIKYSATRKIKFAFGIYEFNIEKINGLNHLSIIPQNSYKNFLSNAMILSKILKNPYILYIDGMKVGEIEASYLCYSLVTGRSNYKIRLHKKNILSIWESDTQIGIVKRVKESMKGVAYEVVFLHSNDDYVISLCIFAINGFFRFQGGEICNDEDIFVISVWNDKYSNAAYWGEDNPLPNKQQKLIDSVIFLILAVSILTIAGFSIWLSWFSI